MMSIRPVTLLQPPSAESGGGHLPLPLCTTAPHDLNHRFCPRVFCPATFPNLSGDSSTFVSSSSTTMRLYKGIKLKEENSLYICIQCVLDCPHTPVTDKSLSLLHHVIPKKKFMPQKAQNPIYSDV